MKKILLTGTIVMSGLGVLSCGKGAGEADSAKEYASKTAVVAYDADRAKVLCEKYGSGMLTEKDYAEIIGMVSVSYEVLASRCDSLVDAEQNRDSLEIHNGLLQAEWQQEFPNAVFLAQILFETDSATLGDKNMREFVRLDSVMNRRKRMLDEKWSSKFGSLD